MFMIECDVPKCGSRGEACLEEQYDGKMFIHDLPNGWSRLILFEEVKLKQQKTVMRSEMKMASWEEPIVTTGELLPPIIIAPVFAKRVHLICEMHDLPIARGKVQKEINEDRFVNFKELFMPGGLPR